jgi:GT2 family glycosyltransferase
MGTRGTLTVVVAYHNTDDLAKALESLGGASDVFVVDNGGDDDVQAVAEANGADYARPPQNIGFAAAVNLGLAARGDRDVLLLNPDARVSPATVNVLERELRAEPRLCAVAPRLEGEDGAPERVAWPVPSPREEWVKAFRLQRLLPPARTFLIGAALLLRNEAIEDVGLFDERFFLYAEECDWQFRAQKRGWSVRVVEGAVAVHQGGGSSEHEARRQHQFHKAAELFALKWYGRKGWASMRVASQLGAAVRLAATLPNPRRRARYARQLRL